MPLIMLISVRAILCLFLMAAGVVGYAENAGSDSKPVPVRTPPPEYPPQLRIEKREGTVVLLVTINEKGAVSDCAVSKSSDTRFEDAAIAAVRKWVFKPAIKNNVPVSSKVTLPIRFSLEQ
jgi:periplasmic protein TonB